MFVLTAIDREDGAADRSLLPGLFRLLSALRRRANSPVMLRDDDDEVGTATACTVACCQVIFALPSAVVAQRLLPSMPLMWGDWSLAILRVAMSGQRRRQRLHRALQARVHLLIWPKSKITAASNEAADEQDLRRLKDEAHRLDASYIIAVQPLVIGWLIWTAVQRQAGRASAVSLQVHCSGLPRERRTVRSGDVMKHGFVSVLGCGGSGVSKC